MLLFTHYNVLSALLQEVIPVIMTTALLTFGTLIVLSAIGLRWLARILLKALAFALFFTMKVALGIIALVIVGTFKLIVFAFISFGLSRAMSRFVAGSVTAALLLLI